MNARVFRMVVAVADGRTLDELDPPAWGTPDYGSYLIRRAHELRRVPLRDFSVEDLRLMIGQQIGLQFLVPRALDLLAVDPLVGGDFFRGDLLEAVMRIDDSYWTEHPDQLKHLGRLVGTLVPVDGEVRAAVESFRAKHGPVDGLGSSQQ